MTFHVEYEIAARPEQAFDGMADVRNEIHWNSRVSRAELRSSEPVRLGSRFMTVNSGTTYDSTIVTFDRPKALTIEVGGKSMDLCVRFSFATIGENLTRLTGDFEMQPKGAMRLLTPFLRLAIRRELPQHSASFARWIESRTTPPTI